MDKTTKTVVKAIGFTVAAIAVLILLFGSFYTIKEQEQAVVTTFGVPSTVSEPGLHMKIPFIQKVQKVDTTIKGFAIGYDETTSIAKEDESLMITSDYNFVNVDFYVEYQVSDPVKALYASGEPVKILKNVAQSCIRSVVGQYEVDSVITDGKSEIQTAIKERIITALTEHEIGIRLVNITIQDAEPPTTEVMEAFKAVETAKQGMETAINNAKKYQNEKLPNAEAQVDKILKEAEATKEARINEAEGQAARFNALYEEYIKYPLITKQRMYYEAMEELLPNLKLIIDSSDGAIDKWLPLDSWSEDIAPAVAN
ncbi:MAG: FtsH protease activity modulator HflK [Lachnospiraceae bacterium]|nr:FtsH protease activity modulator HflK [Lachnospiraceae bacterium]